MKNHKKYIIVSFIVLMIFVSVFVLSSCSIGISSNYIERKANSLLENDLNSDVKIIKLYYNEKEQGCYVEFQTPIYTDKAAIHLDTHIIYYASEFDYYSKKAEELRKQKPINVEKLAEYNQKILDAASLRKWGYATLVFETNGRPSDSDWRRVK